MRVGIVSLYHESNTFLPRETTLEDFRRGLLLGSKEIPGQFHWKHHEISGFFDGLRHHGIEPAPLLIAWAIPGGTITSETINDLLVRLQNEVSAAGKLDGMLAAPHGAAVGQGIQDVDGHWLAMVREHLGPEAPLIATLDVHANLSPQMVRATTALIGYRTNPHLDQYQRGRDAADLMARTLRGEVHPTQAAAFPPLAINIESQCTDESPCRELYALADRMLQRPGILSNSILLGFPYADVEKMGSSVLAVTDNDPDGAQAQVNELARTLWMTREQFRGTLLGIEEALDQAAVAPAPVCLLDMGDNVGGGSPGDGTLLAHCIARRQMPGFVCLFDPASAEAATAAGVGNRVCLEMGGHTDSRHGRPLRARVTVLRIHEGRFTEEAVRHGGMQSFDMGHSAVVRTDTNLTVMLTSRRVFPVSLAQLTTAGLDPGDFRVIVAKGVHAPVAAYRQVCPTLLRVNTPGVTRADCARLHYAHRRRPLYPFEDM